MADAIVEELAWQLDGHPRREICEESEEIGDLIVVCDDLEQCSSLSDRFAPEHLELLVERPEALAERIQQCGGDFHGRLEPRSRRRLPGRAEPHACRPVDQLVSAVP